MSSILIDWLTNLTKTFSSSKRKFLNIIKKANNQRGGPARANRFEVPSKGGQFERAGSLGAKAGERRGLLTGDGAQRAAPRYSTPNQLKQQVNIDSMMERLNQNKIYLIQKQQEYDYKISNMKSLNKDLAMQYNELFDKGKNIYNAFFELFYQVR